MKNPNVLIFGAGEISNLLIKELTLTGNKVLCVSDNKYGQVHNLSHKNLKILSYEEILNQRLEIDTVIFAWKDSARLIQNNNAILNWIESENFSAIKSFHLSSASVYNDSKTPQNENCKVLEQNTKLRLEKFLTKLASKKAMAHLNLRLSNVYGVEVSYGFIGSLLNSLKNGSEVRIFEDLSIIRDYVHVKDVVYAIKLLLVTDTNLKTINISTGIGTTISQVLDIFATHGYHFEKRKKITGDLKIKQASILDCSTLSKIITWQPRYLALVINEILPTKRTSI